MKTTIKLDQERSLTVDTGAVTAVRLQWRNSESGAMVTIALTEDQAGALIFGIEAALETQQLAAARAAA